MKEEDIINAQLEFFKKGKTGCLFAAYAARDPKRFEWKFSISDINPGNIEKIIQDAITAPDISTQSIIFPTVLTLENLKYLLRSFSSVPSLSLEQCEEYLGAMCLGYRIKVGSLTSWVTGFGGFDFLPKTRQSMFTEITFRSKHRPPYEWVMKEAPPNVTHLADMEMKGMNENQFKSLWYGSFAKVEEVLGEKPDLRSASKTTFAIPQELWMDIR